MCIYVHIHIYKYTFSFSESFENNLETLWSFAQNIYMYIRKFNINTILLPGPESVFIVPRIYKSFRITKLYHCERQPFLTEISM